MLRCYSGHNSSEIFKLYRTSTDSFCQCEETSRRMRSLMCLLFLVIFCSVQMTSSANPAIEATNSNCCGEFSKVKVPVNKVVSYYWTSSICARRAIVFKTIAGREFCINPETSWVRSHVDIVDKRTATPP
ncbi:monocyte chemotactic protein 1B-like isoform X2 [Carassius carassius]|uniref:monocyte chemotactic protein 1B-like isoform X2 n=1 Tax=Carassius carassius TaxID=217509 RepID=UPI0028690C88|nr:monocyte chemotactic protein 1B-like isoform X2 [Carassius carassius]